MTPIEVGTNCIFMLTLTTKLCQKGALKDSLVNLKTSAITGRAILLP